MDCRLIEFHLDGRSGVSPYMQLIQQVRRALRLGLLTEGDQLPTVKDVVAKVAINPNTVLKAYRELELEGLVAARPGVGTFVTRTLADASVAAHGRLSKELRAWLDKARAAGLDDASIEALFVTTFKASTEETT
jgi:GntR family transcriptional regulator